MRVQEVKTDKGVYKSGISNICSLPISDADEANVRNMSVNFLEVKNSLISYIGIENIPDDKMLIQLIGKVLHNRFALIKDNDIKMTSCLLFIGASKFDHSCIPNSARNCDELSISFRAIKPIQKSEKITIAYTKIVNNIASSVAHESTMKSFGGSCYCRDCSQPFGQSVLTKVIDMSKALSVLLETKQILELASVMQLNGNSGVISFQRLTKLLQDQEGVLGHTNLYRMRTLAWLCLFMEDIPGKVRRQKLKQLEETMVEVWGKYYPELLSVYLKLIKVNMNLQKRQEALMYARKVCQLRTVCFGFEIDNIDLYAEELCNRVHLTKWCFVV